MPIALPLAQKCPGCACDIGGSLSENAIDRRLRFILIAVLAAGFALRIYGNNAAVFSLGDEATYLRHGRELAAHLFARFPAFASGYVLDPARWNQPGPQRWAHWALLANVCALPGGCGFPALTTLSTLSGIAALLFTWLLGREWIGSKAALVAVALTAVSPLQLHLGRRALQDEISGALILAALWAVSRAFSLEASRRDLSRHGLALLLCTLALAEKETALLWAPAFFSLWFLRHRARGWRREDLLLLLAPLLSLAGFCILSRSFTLFYRDALATLSGISRDRYAAQNVGGPLHIELLDLFVLSPLPFLAAIAAYGSAPIAETRPQSGPRELRWVFFLAVAAFALTLKDIRYLAAADSLLCLLAGSFLVAATARFRQADLWLAAILCITAALQLQTFHHVFVDLDVYDPTTVNLLRALGAVPRAP